MPVIAVGRSSIPNRSSRGWLVFTFSCRYPAARWRGLPGSLRPFFPLFGQPTIPPFSGGFSVWISRSRQPRNSSLKMSSLPTVPGSRSPTGANGCAREMASPARLDQGPCHDRRRDEPVPWPGDHRRVRARTTGCSLRSSIRSSSSVVRSTRCTRSPVMEHMTETRSSQRSNNGISCQGSRLG